MKQPTPTHSITLLIEDLKAGDSVAAQRLWEVYFQQMVGLARQKLGHFRRGADEEDIALSAFKSFCLGIRRGRFTQALDRTNLWSLLIAITMHKSVDHIRRENRQKRGGSGRTDEERDDHPIAGAEVDLTPLSAIISKEPDPQFVGEMIDQFEALLFRLDASGDSSLKPIALLKMEGDSAKEIAQKLNCARRTVERKLELIRSLWEQEPV